LQGFQEAHHEFYDPITEWIEEYYLARFVSNNQFQSFLALVGGLGVYEDTFARSF